MYARLLPLRSSKLGCFPRRLASSSSGPRVPEQAVRAIFLIFALSFLSNCEPTGIDRSGLGRTRTIDQLLRPLIQFLTRATVRVFNRTFATRREGFVSSAAVINKTTDPMFPRVSVRNCSSKSWRRKL